MPVDFPQTFQIIDGSKRPAVKWTDPAACVSSTVWPAPARYGVATGARNGVWVLDLDVKDGKDGSAALTAFAAGRDVPETYTVRTPSGGWHMYWRYDRPVGNPVGILPGVDVRGDGGYVCAGGDYAVVVDAEPAEAPEWLYALVTSRTAATVKGESAVAIGPEHPEWAARLATAQTFIRGEPPCVSGQGGQGQIWKMGLRLMRTLELPIDAAVELLSEYNSRCVPPWTEAELRHHLLNAAEKGSGPTGTFAGSFLASLAGPSPGKVPAPVEGSEWRQRPDPAHTYSIDLSAYCAGAMIKTVSLGPKELTGVFSGPGAPPPWVGVWQYDAFRRRVVAVNPPFKLDAEVMGISRRDLASVQVWAACTGGKASIEQIASAIDVASRQAEYHPVRDYLDALPELTLADADRYFTGVAGRLWGAEARDALESGHLRRLAIAAVRRIKVPGTKVDTMLVLAGEQGFRKSLLCARLFGEYFLDQLPPVMSGRGHEASIAIEGRWGVEIAEMNALAHAHESAKKEFLTRCVDKYRPVFGVAMQEVPRQCVFIGTTNDDDFLTDPTGDTRYDVCDIRQEIDLDSLDRDAFWAAAVALEKSGEAHYRDRALLARAGKSADVSGEMFGNGGILVPTIPEGAGFASEDIWTDDVLRVARVCSEATGGFATAKGCLTSLAVPLDRQDARAHARVKGILRRAFGASCVQWLDGRPQRCYRVPGG